MDDHELQSDSDTSDEDFVPEGVENEGALSVEESGDEVDESDNEHQTVTNAPRKRGKSATKKSRKKFRKEESQDEKKIEEENPCSLEEKKKREEALWADFMKDCGPPVKKSTLMDIETKVMDEKENDSEAMDQQQSLNSKKVKVTQIFEFAGEKVEVEKEVSEREIPRGLIGARGRGRGRGGGLSAVLGMIGKKGKLSTLEKSKLDWEKFKDNEGIQEDIRMHNKGKKGYLERQDFLERADHRQFEIEKEMRSSRRSNR